MSSTDPCEHGVHGGPRGCEKCQSQIAAAAALFAPTPPEPEREDCELCGGSGVDFDARGDTRTCPCRALQQAVAELVTKVLLSPPTPPTRRTTVGALRRDGLLIPLNWPDDTACDVTIRSTPREAEVTVRIDGVLEFISLTLTV